MPSFSSSKLRIVGSQAWAVHTASSVPSANSTPTTRKTGAADPRKGPGVKRTVSSAILCTAPCRRSPILSWVRNLETGPAVSFTSSSCLSAPPILLRNGSVLLDGWPSKYICVTIFVLSAAHLEVAVCRPHPVGSSRISCRFNCLESIPALRVRGQDGGALKIGSRGAGSGSLGWPMMLHRPAPRAHQSVPACRGPRPRGRRRQRYIRSPAIRTTISSRCHRLLGRGPLVEHDE